MNQKPVVASTTELPKTPELKPVLAAALASLEVQLDQELSRYRRTRFAYRTPSKSQSFISLSAEEKLVQASITPNTTEDLHHQQSIINIKQQPTIDAANIVPTVSQPIEEEKINTQPEDYLESSEALLRSMGEEQPISSKPVNTNDSFLSPLGIGSILLLLVSSLTLGYVFFNPRSLSHLSFNGAVSQKAQSPTSNVETSTSNVSIVPTPQLTPIAKYPNLATDEFPEVKNPNDVVDLKPKPKPIVVPSPKPTVEQKLTQPVTPITSVQPGQKANSLPSKISTPPIASIQPTPQLPNYSLAEIKPSADGYYHIVSDNSGNDAFATARKVVPDAYLSPDGKSIYLGALKSKNQALHLLSQLQSKGFQAKIQQP